MTRFIKRYAQRRGATVVEENGNLYVTKGRADLYPCIVAHTDTVHAIIPDADYKVYFKDGYYFAWNKSLEKHTGVGGDDKVGIYIALVALSMYDNIKMAFFRDEEIGCVGSRLADMEFFKDCTLVLQGDRRGNDDFVSNIYSTTLYSKDFAEAIAPILKTYGYSESSGAMTDVQELSERGLGLCCANFSCGYHSPHTSKEYIDVDDVQNCMGMVYTIINTLGSTKWEHTPTKRYKTYTPYTSMYDDDVDGWRSEWYNGYSRQTDSAYMPRATTHDSRRYYGVDNDIILPMDDGECPYCRQDDMISFEEDLNMYFCERCVSYLMHVGV